MQVKETLTEVFRMVFDDDGIEISDQTTADDIDGWDSLSHINLILAVESRFKIKFADREILSFKNVGDMMKCVQGKLPPA
jgi:acyl carrier protein